MSDDHVLRGRVHRTLRDLTRQPGRRRHAALAFRISPAPRDLVADLRRGRPLSPEDAEWISDLLEAALASPVVTAPAA